MAHKNTDNCRKCKNIIGEKKTDKMLVSIQVKSAPAYFEKEKEGIKPNTVRKIPFGDGRDIIIKKWAETKEYGTITVINAITGEKFTRQVTDVTLWKGNAIISWRHEKNG